MPRNNLYTKSNNNEDYRKNISHRHNIIFPKEIDVNLTDDSINRLCRKQFFMKKVNNTYHIVEVIVYLILFIVLSIALFIILNHNLFNDGMSFIEVFKDYLYSSIISVIIMVVSALVFGITKVRFKKKDDLI